MSDTLLLSLIVFLPSLAALVLLLVPGRAQETIKGISLAATLVTFALTIILLDEYISFPEAYDKLADRAATALQDRKDYLKEHPDALFVPDKPRDLVFRHSWIETRAINVEYYMGVDGVSLPLVLLTGLICLLAMIASWNIEKHIRGYCILFLLLETGMMGTFLALDFFLFYVFWEIMLLPMYFLIGIWGAPSRQEADGRVRGGPYAAIKFFLYTLVGSVLLLIALLGFYFHDVPLTQAPANQVTEDRVQPAGSGPQSTAAEQIQQTPGHSFDLMKLAEWGMTREPGLIYPFGFQLLMFALLYVGFAIKVPVFPFHTWLPDAHVEAPTPISMILAGILLKMGGYGFIRIAYPLCPQAAMYLAWPMALIGVWNIIYGAFAAMAQTDFKKLVAYSSVSHMGYVILGMAVWSMQGSGMDPYIWSAGMNGAMFQMIAHGISSAGMFFMVGVIYDRVHHRDLNRFGGLATEMPLYGGLSAGIFFAGLGLPGLCGFVGEVMTVLASWQFSRVLAVIAALGVILTAGYILWTLQRVFLGVSAAQLAHGHGPSGNHGNGDDHSHALSDMTFREMLCAVPLLIFAIALGVYPKLLFGFMEPSVTALTEALSRIKAAW